MANSSENDTDNRNGGGRRTLTTEDANQLYEQAAEYYEKYKGYMPESVQRESCATWNQIGMICRTVKRI